LFAAVSYEEILWWVVVCRML